MSDSGAGQPGRDFAFEVELQVAVAAQREEALIIRHSLGQAAQISRG